ncbi:hypothetical protein [Embleya scabrispora]|uniref:hypothetical protein n=1 Tax=Embleya scabrispora TaxID=159449 RepID=UPI0003A14BE6|nr:hypothetical protein [Embleya scabrispora]MYS85067.1 hypothetical protein [Streptomyces sp. SID5474]
MSTSSVPRPILRRSLAVSAAFATLACMAVGIQAAPAYADAPDCNPNVTRYRGTPITAVLTPVITEWDSFAVAPGTSIDQTRTLTQVNSVSTSVNNSVDFSSEDKTTLGSVGTKFGLSVATSAGSTTTSTLTENVHFNQPGVYGLYRGTERVEGQWLLEICGRTGPTTGKWVWVGGPAGTGTYVTFTFPDQGTVSCAQAEPPGTVRAVARARLHC